MMDSASRVEPASLATGPLAVAFAACPHASHILLIDHPAAVECVRDLLRRAAAPHRPYRVILCGAFATDGWPHWCQVSAATDRETGVAALGAEIAAWPMGTRLHPIGSANLVAAAFLVAVAAGMHRDGIHATVLDAGFRRVRCVHCRTVGEAAPGLTRHTCAGCGTVLKVRPLFSQRHQAFLGVADPEAVA